MAVRDPTQLSDSIGQRYTAWSILFVVEGAGWCEATDLQCWQWYYALNARAAARFANQDGQPAELQRTYYNWWT